MEPTQSDKKIFAINPDLQKQVSPILTSMVSMLLKKKPQDPVSLPVLPCEQHLNPIAKQLDFDIFTGATHGTVPGGGARCRYGSAFL